MRKMKPSPSGSGGKKKAYYLENAMQFCLPFIKTVIPPSTGNLPRPPSSTQPSDGDTEGFETQIDDPTQIEDKSINAPQNSPPMSPSILDVASPHQIVTPLESSSSKMTPQTLKRSNKNSASAADESVAEYFKAKKAKLVKNATEGTSNQRIDRQQGIKMFLLSLMPELEELSDSQIKMFKRQVLKVIDDISATDHHQPPRPSSNLTILTSPTMSDSRDSQINLAYTSNVVGETPTADFYEAFSQNRDM